MRIILTGYRPLSYRLEDLGTSNVLSAHNLLLVPTKPKWKLTYSAFLLFTSTGEEIKMKGREIFCDTPSTVSVDCRCSMSAVVAALERNSISVLPTIDANALFVSSSNEPHTASSEFGLVKLGALPPSSTPIHISTNKLRSSLGVISSPLVIYQLGAAPQLLTTIEGPLPIFIKPNSGSFRIATLYSLPCAPKQLIGVLTPAVLRQLHPDSPHTSTATIVGDSSASPHTSAYDSTSRATLTLSRSRTTRVLFTQPIRIPPFLTRNLGWISRLPLIATLCHIMLNIVALVLPRFGLSFSLQWGKGNSQQQFTSPKSETKPLVAAPLSLSSDADAADELEFEVEPVDGEVQVVLHGDAADSVMFMINKEKVDPWSVIQTSHGERLHQFTIQTNNTGVLGVSASF